MHIGYPILLLATCIAVPVSAQFLLKDSFIGYDFLRKFAWETLDDPTHGRVNYVDQDTALQLNLTYANSKSFVMRADNSNVVSPTTRGRNSIRIKSYAAYTDSVVVLDLQHMPEGCSTWPAFWTLSQAGPWPHGGEIDIIEGVNKNVRNLASLHATPGCTVPQQRRQTGSSVSTNCDTSVNGNQGCGTSFSQTSSYGSAFNDLGGGWFVMTRSADDGVSVYFWSRSDPNVPLYIKYPSKGLFVDGTWGPPAARFPTDTCDFGSHFDGHQLIFDLTFCGDWAGSVFPSSGCGPSNCNDFVDNNPQAFSNAYWEVNALRVYLPFL